MADILHVAVPVIVAVAAVAAVSVAILWVAGFFGHDEEDGA